MFDKVRSNNSFLRAPNPGEVIPNQFSCTEFGLPDTSQMTEDEKLNYLADILIQWYVEEYDRK
jgi:hypothetical protein